MKIPGCSIQLDLNSRQRCQRPAALPFRARIIRTRAFALVMLLATMGCMNPWYLVESTYRPAPLDERLGWPQIVRSAKYTQSPKDGLTVALRAPDYCANLSAAQTTGEAIPAGDLIRTDCGVEMAELERVLVSRGHRVISWNEVNARVKQRPSLSPVDAAKDLKADVLFEVNSLERLLVGGGIGSVWSRSYFTVGFRGRKGDPIQVPIERAAVFDDAMQRLEAPRTPPARLAVAIDITAVSTENAESIWFYHETRMDDSTEYAYPREVSQLFECDRRQLDYCLRRDTRFSDPRAGGLSSSSRIATNRRSGGGEISQPNAQLDAYARTVYFGLVEDVMADLVAEYSKGRR